MLKENPPCPFKACRGTEKKSVKYGKQQNGTQRYRCKDCGRTFTKSRGTIFENLTSNLWHVKLAIQWTAKGFSLLLTSKILDVKPETVKGWLTKFGKTYAPYERCFQVLTSAGSSHEEAECICGYADLGTPEQHRTAIAYSRKVSTQIRGGDTPPLDSIDKIPAEIADELRKRYERAVAEIRGEAT